MAFSLPPAYAAGRAPAFVLAPGAGSDMDHPSLVGLAVAVARAGFVVCRFDFPYRCAGRRLPDRLPALTAAYGAVVEHVRTDAAFNAPWIAIGGRSMGGRVASHLAAAGVAVHGLVFLAFPLHPAGRPATFRAAHLPGIAAPMLFVQGTRDALATWESSRTRRPRAADRDAPPRRGSRPLARGRQAPTGTRGGDGRDTRNGRCLAAHPGRVNPFSAPRPDSRYRPHPDRRRAR